METQLYEKFKPLKIIHGALVLGVSLAYYFMGNEQFANLFDFPEVASESLVFILIPLFAFLASRMLFKQILLKGNELADVRKPIKLENHFAAYQTACLVRWAVLEGAAFILLFLKPEFIVFGILLILYMAFLRPSAEELKRELGA
ncbi:hypothetical protein SAMN04490243_2580 [Robiginitalea myxolifaciens]|uniref:Uncharacterized protein n=1 Tax=Robiginitalea myxolifaciens TaxID=400055 RepID=A0A1I6HD19_9FLAO|nr:hypothetical protein [Robiginitalea myxolifaciens]SFR52339.1 hypothetical protein SAMN04490243_2580 [Robiginitalea myxolifaciens]